MLHRLREAWARESSGPFQGPVEVDESYFGGKRKNMSNAKRKTLEGRGSVGKTAVVGAKDRAGNRVSAKVVRSGMRTPSTKALVVVSEIVFPNLNDDSQNLTLFIHA